jgi:hypothetical protein
MKQVAVSGSSTYSTQVGEIVATIDLSFLSNDVCLATGAQPGIPEILAKNHICNNGNVIGYSPFSSLEEHTRFFKFNPSHTQMRFRQWESEGFLKDILRRNTNLVLDSSLGIYFFTANDQEKYSIGVAHEMTCALNGGVPLIIYAENTRLLEKIISHLNCRTNPEDIHLIDTVGHIKSLVESYQ